MRCSTELIRQTPDTNIMNGSFFFLLFPFPPPLLPLSPLPPFPPLFLLLPETFSRARTLWFHLPLFIWWLVPYLIPNRHIIWIQINKLMLTSNELYSSTCSWASHSMYMLIIQTGFSYEHQILHIQWPHNIYTQRSNEPQIFLSQLMATPPTQLLRSKPYHRKRFCV